MAYSLVLEIDDGQGSWIERRFARAQTIDVTKRRRPQPEMKKLSWCSESLSTQKGAEARVMYRVQGNRPEAKTVWVKDGTLVKLNKEHQIINIDVVQSTEMQLEASMCFKCMCVCVCHTLVHICTSINF